MDVLSSAEFRKRYASLTATTVVTVNGHTIGTWVPMRYLPDGTAWSPAIPEDAPPPRPMTQAQRDAILRRVNRKEPRLDER